MTDTNLTLKWLLGPEVEARCPCGRLEFDRTHTYYKGKLSAIRIHHDHTGATYCEWAPDWRPDVWGKPVWKVLRRVVWGGG